MFINYEYVSRVLISKKSSDLAATDHLSLSGFAILI